MLYQWAGIKQFDGHHDYMDVSDLLQDLLHPKQLQIQLKFKTQGDGYQCLFGIYYKESLLPDFGLYLMRGYPTLLTKQAGRREIYHTSRACNDGEIHTLRYLAGDGSFVLLLDDYCLLQGACDSYCCFDYVGFATIGRGCCCDAFDHYFCGTMYEVLMSRDRMERSLPATKETLDDKCRPVPLFERGMLGCENYRIPCLIATAKGDLLACADARPDAPGDNPNHIARAIRISHDNGNTWTEPRIVLDYGGYGRRYGAAAIDGSLLLDNHTKRLFMFYSHTPQGIGSASSRPATGFDESGRKLCEDKAATSFLQYIFSDDEGESWSAPIDLNHQVKAPWMTFIGPGPGRGLCMTTGRLVVPIYYGNAQGRYCAAVIYSDDHGCTWHRGGGLSEIEKEQDGADSDTEPITTESQVVERKDGSLLIVLRNTGGHHIRKAVSHDGGESWHSLKTCPELTDPGCQCSVVRWGDRLAFSNPASARTRSRGTLHISDDEGESWAFETLIDAGDFGYSCLCPLPDGGLGVLYEGRDVALFYRRLL